MSDGAGFLIYGLVDPRTGEVRYIGRSVSGLNRPRQHSNPCLLNGSRTHKANWIRSVLATGVRPQIRVLEVVQQRADLSDVERFWIAQGRGLGWPLTNVTSGGEGLTGYTPTPETREKVRAALLGRKRGPHTLEARLKIGLSGIGRKVSAETRAKISAASRGVPKSPEMRSRLSATKTGQRRPSPSPETKAKMRAAQQLRREQERRRG